MKKYFFLFCLSMQLFSMEEKLYIKSSHMIRLKEMDGNDSLVPVLATIVITNSILEPYKRVNIPTKKLQKSIDEWIKEIELELRKCKILSLPNSIIIKTGIFAGYTGITVYRYKNKENIEWYVYNNSLKQVNFIGSK